MSGFDENGFHKPGTIGIAAHRGEPLTAQQIRELPDGAEIVITWDGGNGPWPERVLVDSAGERRTESLYCDLLLPFGLDQRRPLHRVTLGWTDDERQWHDGRYQSPREREEWARLRGHA